MTGTGPAAAEAEVTVDADADTVYRLIRWSTTCTVSRLPRHRADVGPPDAVNAKHIKATLRRLKEKAETG